MSMKKLISILNIHELELEQDEMIEKEKIYRVQDFQIDVHLHQIYKVRRT